MQTNRFWLAVFGALVACLFAAHSPTAAHAEGSNAIVTLPGGPYGDMCKTYEILPSIDGTSAFFPIPFTFDFYGRVYKGLWVNDDGGVSFWGPGIQFAGDTIQDQGSTAIIVPFSGEVETRFAGKPVTFGNGTYDGRPTFCADWVDVNAATLGPAPTGRLNSFQLLIVDRSDTGPGNVDIYFNYDKIEWETSETEDGFGDPSAASGWSTGIGRSFSLPGSAVPGSFLDSSASGLIHHSLDSSQPGRYRFEIRNGSGGHSLSGHVYGEGIGLLPNAPLQLCADDPSIPCRTGTSDASGAFSFSGLPNAVWSMVAYPPAGVDLGPGVGSGFGWNVGSADSTGLFVFLPQTPGLPADTTVTSPLGTSASGTPTVRWDAPFTIRTHGCQDASSARARVEVAADAYTLTIALSQTSPGTFEGTFGALSPHHGTASVTITLDCADGPITVDFGLYIDPSGTVVTTAGEPLEGATVTIYRSDTPTGVFQPVPDGSSILSPMNRRNPDTTSSGGTFGWDVLAGFYKVRAAKPGCHDPGDPGRPFVESNVLTVPPPAVGLVLKLDCSESAAPDFDGLLSLIGDMGLDRSPSQVLASRARDAAAKAGAGDPAGACAALGDLVAEAIARTGKASPKVTVPQAKQLAAAANAIQIALGCLPPTETLTGAESTVLDLIGAIDDLATGLAPWTNLRTDAQNAGRQLALERPSDACTTLGTLATTATKKLQPAAGAALAPLVQAARVAASC